jgi:hypothetical protein
LLPPATNPREKPLGVAVSLPESAESLIELRGNRDLAGLASFTIDNANDEALAVDVLGFDANRFAQTETALIDDGEVGAVSTVPEGSQESRDFLSREDMRKRFAAVNLDLPPDVPIATEMIAVEETDGTKRLVDGGSLEASLLLEMDEEVEDLGRTDPGCGLVRVEMIELTNPPEIILFRLLTEVFEMDSPDEILVPLLRSDGAI